MDYAAGASSLVPRAVQKKPGSGAVAESADETSIAEKVVPTEADFLQFESTLEPETVRAVHATAATTTVENVDPRFLQEATRIYGADGIGFISAYLDWCRRSDQAVVADGGKRTDGSNDGGPHGDGSEAALLSETPSTTAGYADWLLRARECGFVKFKYHEAQVEKLSKGEEVDNLEPGKTDVGILAVEVDLVKARIRKWVEQGGDKAPLVFGSMIRPRGNAKAPDVHSEGEAIDINDLSQTTTVEPVIEILLSLDAKTDRSYGVGLPFQGDFFDGSNEVDAKKATAEASAGDATETSFSDGLMKGSTYVWEGNALRSGGKWKWTVEKKAAGTAYTHLKSGKLLSTFASLRNKGFTFDIFPDNDDHMHLDRR